MIRVSHFSDSLHHLIRYSNYNKVSDDGSKAKRSRDGILFFNRRLDGMEKLVIFVLDLYEHQSTRIPLLVKNMQG